jgi:hypothetical protein
MLLSSVLRLIVRRSAYRTVVLDRRRGLLQRGRDSLSLGGWEVGMLIIRACDIVLTCARSTRSQNSTVRYGRQTCSTKVGSQVSEPHGNHSAQADP